jgi:hypothetical protein
VFESSGAVQADGPGTHSVRPRASRGQRVLLDELDGGGDLSRQLARDRGRARGVGRDLLALVSYLIACESYEDAEQGELVKSYLSYVTSDEGQQVAADAAGSAPISSDLSTQVAAAIELIK